MASNGGMLDAYLLAQALGMNWDLGTILLLYGVPIIAVLIIMALCVIFSK